MDSQEPWRSQLQSDQQHQPCAKLPKLHPLVDQQQQSSPVSSALALFASQPNSTSICKAATTIPTLSALRDSAATKYPRMGLSFSLAQWQELELQALIYKYMLAGAPVPWELILHIRSSLLTTSPYYHLPQQYQSLQPSWQPGARSIPRSRRVRRRAPPKVLQAGYWGRCVIDPEPGRCRRTDGKKWRCSREVVTGQKYCERHVHRGRNRSRKHVEIPKPAGSGLKSTLPLPLGATKMSQFNQRPQDGTAANGRGYCANFTSQEMQGDKADGQVLRKFFDDWPRTQQELTHNNNNGTSVSATQLSISIPGNSSDFSLKLSTGNSGRTGPGSNKDSGDRQVQPSAASWTGWGSHGEASMGGPLAEALRSSTTTHSPTSVLGKPNGSVSETSSISA